MNQITKIQNFFDRNKILIAFVILALAAGYAITVASQHTARQASRNLAYSTWQTQLSQCKAADKNREKINNGLAAQVETNAYVLQRFLSAASAARAAEYKAQHIPSDNQTAKEYAFLSQYDKSHTHVVKLTLTNCTKVYPRP